MTITFYPHEDDLETSSIPEKLDALLEAAERYKGIVLDAAAKAVPSSNPADRKRTTPRDITNAYNWEEIAKVMSEIRNLTESTASNKLTKAQYLSKLAEIYEILRAAKMPKLEAVRLALINEAGQLKTGGSQVA